MKSVEENFQVNELWEEICFILQDIPPLCSEELYEQKIIQSLEKLGWNRFHKEIILKQSTQLGSAGTIIPDIIVKSLNKNESFVIEIKKPSADIENQSHKKQLFSYMRQLKLEHGLLIGNKIQIYYDGKATVTEDPILLKSIDISRSNKDGLSFIKLFQKESFSYLQLETFSEKTVKELATERHKKKLLNTLLSQDYKNKIQQFVVDDLQQNWDRSTIQNILSQLSISICLKSPSPPAPSVSHSTGDLNCKSGTKKKSPSTHPWIQEVPELRNISGLKSWADICRHLGVEVGSDSARRALKKWVKNNKPNWHNVP